MRWFVTLGVMLGFVLFSLLPVYGMLRPWPQAQEQLKQEGITGLVLMIGADSHSEREGTYWRKERQRSYLIVPDSFRRLEVFTYSEWKGSGIMGVQMEVRRSRILIPLLAVWMIAGSFSVWQVYRWSEKIKAAA